MGSIQSEKYTALTSYHKALLQGLMAVMMFSLTVPMTKMALVSFSPEFIAASRGFVAGILSLLVVASQRWSWPNHTELFWLIFSGFGVVIGFPYLLAISLSNVQASDMGVVLAGVPIATSLTAVFILNERYKPMFWLAAMAGGGVLILYLQTSIPMKPDHGTTTGFSFGLLVLATLGLAGLGYAGGAKAAKTLGAWPTICWILALYLPLTSAAFCYFTIVSPEDHILAPLDHIATETWLALGYLALISQWWGFRHWYNAMSVAGAGSISQLQLIQPFFTLAFSGVLLAETIEYWQFSYALIIVLLVTLALKYK